MFGYFKEENHINVTDFDREGRNIKVLYSEIDKYPILKMAIIHYLQFEGCKYEFRKVNTEQ